MNRNLQASVLTVALDERRVGDFIWLDSFLLHLFEVLAGLFSFKATNARVDQIGVCVDCGLEPAALQRTVGLGIRT